MSEHSPHGALPARKGTREALIWAGLFLVILSILTMVSVLLAGIVKWRGPRLARLESSIIAGGATIAFLLMPGTILVGQPRWLATLVGAVHGSWWPVPWLSILVTAAWYYGLVGLVEGTKTGDKVRGRFHAVIRIGKGPLTSNSLIPHESVRDQVRVASIPGGVVTVPQSSDARSRSFAFGVDQNGRPFAISEDEIGMHGVVLGATGAGKTVTLKAIAAALLDLGWDGMILDLKEDTAPGGLREFCTHYAQTHVVPYQHLALSDTVSEYWLNPLDGMDADYARDTILSLTPFDDFYWSNINKKMLGQLVNLCYDAHASDPTTIAYPTIYNIGSILEQGNLNAATKTLRGIVAVAGGEAERYAALAHPEPDAQKSASGFGAKLTQMYDTIAGRTVLRPGDGRHALDVTAPGLVYVGLDSTGKPDLSVLVSSAILQRMSVYAAQRTTGQSSKTKRRFLIIDEASVANRSILKALLSKARGAGVAVVVCTQGPDDWIDEQGDDWSELTQNINVAVVMAQGSSKSAEICAEFLGETKKLTKSLTLENDEWTTKSTARENVDYLVEPYELRRLGIGEAMVRVNKPVERVSWVAVRPRDATAQRPVRHLRD